VSLGLPSGALGPESMIHTLATSIIRPPPRTASACAVVTSSRTGLHIGGGEMLRRCRAQAKRLLALSSKMQKCPRYRQQRHSASHVNAGQRQNVMTATGQALHSENRPLEDLHDRIRDEEMTELMIAGVSVSIVRAGCSGHDIFFSLKPSTRPRRGLLA
jgi:hypothetical protein